MDVSFYLRSPNEQLSFLFYEFHVIIRRILSHLLFCLFLSVWNMKTIWPAKQKEWFSFVLPPFPFSALVFTYLISEFEWCLSAWISFLLLLLLFLWYYLFVAARMSMMSNEKMKDLKPQEPPCQSNHQLGNTLNAYSLSPFNIFFILPALLWQLLIYSQAQKKWETWALRVHTHKHKKVLAWKHKVNSGSTAA